MNERLNELMNEVKKLPMRFKTGTPPRIEESSIDFEKLDQSIKTISLKELIDIYSKMLKGETSGRYLVDVNK